MVRVLIVDDSSMLRDVFSRSLKGIGADVMVWEPDAVNQIQPTIEGFKPDLMLVDYHMPVCNGATVARQARKSFPNLKIIMLTASNDPELKRFVEQGLVDEIVYKPIGREGLIALVNKYRPDMETPEQPS